MDKVRELIEPWLFAIEEQSEDGRWSWHDGENCVFGDKQSAQDEVDQLNDAVEDWQGSPYRVVPLYRAASEALASPEAAHVPAVEMENFEPEAGSYVYVKGEVINVGLEYVRLRFNGYHATEWIPRSAVLLASVPVTPRRSYARGVRR
jgi:hypothetical protein